MENDVDADVSRGERRVQKDDLEFTGACITKNLEWQ